MARLSRWRTLQTSRKPGGLIPYHADPMPTIADTTTEGPPLNALPPAPPRVPPLDGADDGAALCVLASGSSGNCSVLLTKRRGVVRLTLIDLGLSPRRTFAHLHALGLRPDQIDDALLTHLDHDHFCPTWSRYLPRHARLRLHERHARMLPALCIDRLGDRLRPFASPFDLDDGLHASPMLMSHDESGVCTFRIDLPGFGGGSMGFCTDLGHVSMELVHHLRVCPRGGGERVVDVLALESNYCPQMQLASSRPEALKRRIMGGRGHLSNQQAAEAIAAVQPSEHVVLLHLSRECNDPALVGGLHEGADYAVTIASQFAPTRWVRVSRSASSARPAVVSSRLAASATLFTAV